MAHWAGKVRWGVVLLLWLCGMNLGVFQSDAVASQMPAGSVNMTLVGTWERERDRQRVQFVHVGGNQFKGTIVDPGGSGQFGFHPGEHNVDAWWDGSAQKYVRRYKVRSGSSSRWDEGGAYTIVNANQLKNESGAIINRVGSAQAGPSAPTHPAPGSPISGRAYLVAVTSSRDLVGGSETLRSDGKGDAHLRLHLTAPGRTLTALEMRNTSGELSVWDTIPGNGMWLMAVVHGQQLLNDSQGRLTPFHLPGGEEVLDLYVQDIGGIAGGRISYQMNLQFQDGSRHSLPVDLSRAAQAAPPAPPSPPAVNMTLVGTWERQRDKQRIQFVHVGGNQFKGTIVDPGGSAQAGFQAGEHNVDAYWDAGAQKYVRRYKVRAASGSRWDEGGSYTIVNANQVNNEDGVAHIRVGTAQAAPPPPSQPAPKPTRVIFDNWNKAGVGNGPTKPTQFSVSQATTITYMNTYHWNGGKGRPPGTIALRGSDGKTYGPWQAAGTSGTGGAQNVNWVVKPNVTIPPGTYTVVDSDPTTWSQNSGSGGAGFSSVQGH